MTNIIKESVSGLQHGHKTVGTTAIQLIESLTGDPNKGVLLRCPGPSDPSPNTAPIWVGSKTVTADSAESTGGMPIVPGESLVIPVDDFDRLYVVSSAADQDVAWVAL